MKPLPDEDAEFASLLRAQMPPLPDDGFSRQIIVQLPAPNRSYHKQAWAFTGACAGIGFALLKGTSWADIARGGSELLRLLSTSLSAFGDPWLLVTLSTTVASLLLAYLVRRLHAR